jgi:hypothetical protein
MWKQLIDTPKTPSPVAKPRQLPRRLVRVPFPPSSRSACLRSASALNFRNAASILARLSESEEIVLAANVEPLSKPNSPPKKSPPPPKKKYAAMSPRGVGLSNGVMSGIGSKWGVSDVRLVRALMNRMALYPYGRWQTVHVSVSPQL